MGARLLTPNLNALVERLVHEVRDRYVDADLAGRYAAAIQSANSRGDYVDVGYGPQLAERLTADLHAVHPDRHLRVRWSDVASLEAVGADVENDPEWLADYWTTAALANYGCERVQRLPGNVGLFVLHSIDEAEVTAGVLSAAMAFVARTSALLLDLRANTGGEPTGVAWLVSHFVEPTPRLMTTFRARSGAETQYWTSAFLPVPRYLDRPVFVLTGPGTFSGGEEIAYNLQALGRAQVVGESTAGGANPVDVFRLDPHLALRVPTAVAINAITGRNWEGTGVQPDVPCPADSASDVAHRLAMAEVERSLGEEPAKTHQALRAEVREAVARHGQRF